MPDRISVIITCHNQATNLVTMLQCLQKQSLKPDEVVIADDNSFQPIEAIAQSFGCKYVRTCSSITLPHIAMRSLARQLGTLSSTGDLILYLDGDMMPSRYLLELVWLNHASCKGNIAIKVPRMFRITIDQQLIANMQVPSRHGATVHHLSFEDFQSDCFSVAKKIITDVGGWDTNFLGWGEEDVELAYRFHLAEIPIFCIRHPQLYSIHIDHPVNHDANACSLARNAYYFAQKHPEIRAMRVNFWSSLDSYLSRYGHPWRSG